VVEELQKGQPAVPPVVFLSADSPQVLNLAASSVGATAVRKPFEFDDLFQAIESAPAKAA
jgi:DNA-binding response OmpR family regulator